ncbi:MAG: head-tail connector protein, partial [Selenomonas sp.]|nr:head-tail connector protein [Selenomonas sp.]
VKDLVGKREQYINRWREIRKYQLPHVGQFDGEDNESNAAMRKDTKIYNGAAWEANQIFAAGIMSGLTPPNRKWFRMSFDNEQLTDNTDLGALLDERMNIINNVLERSNFYTSVHSCYLELAFGQAPLGIFPDSRLGVHFVNYPIGSYAMETGPDGTIEIFCRKYKMSARQLVEKFGKENVPKNILNELDNGGAGIKAQHTVVWYVEPNKAYDPAKFGGEYLPYISVYYVEGSDENEFLYIGGFYEFPVPVARYLINGNEAYGKGPGWFAEGDSKALQLMEKDRLVAIELGVKPPVQASPDMANKGINMIPGGKTYRNGDNKIEPLFNVGANLQHLESAIEQQVERIKKEYNANLFMMLDELADKQMTAREVLERNQEKMAILGPVVQRMQFEFLGRIIERVYNILDRAHAFPEPEDPELAQMLQGEEIKIEYISPLAQAQKMSGLVNIEQAVAFAGQLAQFDQNILKKINWSEALNQYFALVGAPAAIKRSDDEYNEMVQAEQQAQAQAMQEQQAMNMIQAAAPAAQAAKNATDAANDGNPVLADLMGMTGGI